MTSAPLLHQTRARKNWFSAVLLGSWAAAIALAPNLTVKLLLAGLAGLLAVAVWSLETPGRWLACFFATARILPPFPLAHGDSVQHL